MGHHSDFFKKAFPPIKVDKHFLGKAEMKQIGHGLDTAVNAVGGVVNKVGDKIIDTETGFIKRGFSDLFGSGGGMSIELMLIGGVVVMGGLFVVLRK